MENRSRNDLAAQLLAACQDEPNNDSLPSLSSAIMDQFLRMGSRTEDNLNAYAHIEYGLSEPHWTSGKVYGLKVKGTDISISDAMHALEGLAVPPEIKEEFPELSDAQWDAIRRMTTMVLLSIEGYYLDSSEED